ncbi:MAG: hypothetical protein KQH53_11565 [Desulfarculaceae bacterium]|nr:hypothetical protein [Desulfarculaceae bacterium]
MPSRRAITFCLALLAALFWAAPARANIKLSITVRPALQGSALTVRIGVVNQGNEAAKRLGYAVYLGETVARAQGAADLPPGGRDQAELTLPFSPTLPGGYGVGVRVDYHDINGYPLSAVSWGLFKNQTLAIAPRLLRGRPGNPWPGKPPAFELHNPLDSPLEVTLRVLAPAEFVPDRLTRTLTLGPRQEVRVPLELENRAALVGSTYPLAGLVSYVHQGKHHIGAAQSLLSVGLLSDPLYAWRPWLWALAGLLLAALLALAWVRRRRAA